MITNIQMHDLIQYRGLSWIVSGVFIGALGGQSAVSLVSKNPHLACAIIGDKPIIEYTLPLEILMAAMDSNECEHYRRSE